MALRVEHSKKALEFFIRMNNTRSILQYRKHPDNVMDIYHTEVPVEHQGKGIAKVLVNEAFQYAAENNMKILPTCTYVDRFARKFANDEQKRIVLPLDSHL
uniref:Protein NATD1 n=1 Tax=Steinernema glaseri TaxID=37863 RepID=A0A1I7YV11_9BILA